MILLNKGQIIYLNINGVLTLVQISYIDELTELVTCRKIQLLTADTSESKEFTVHMDYLIRLNYSIIETLIKEGKENTELYYSPYKKRTIIRILSSLKRVGGKDPSNGGKENNIPGRILHLEGVKSFVETCFKQYQSTHVEILCKYVPEIEQPALVKMLLPKYRPDILILTGHDSMLPGNKDLKNIENYRNSKFFVDAIKAARSFEKDKNKLVIFAGGCQSCYEELIKAGANFASSPKRILIHSLDPVLIATKIALTSSDVVIPPKQISEETISGYDGIRGVRTRGKCITKHCI